MKEVSHNIPTPYKVKFPSWFVIPVLNEIKKKTRKKGKRFS